MLFFRTQRTLLVLLIAVSLLSCKKDESIKADKLKIISYNVYYGMREDESPEKELFVNWVNSQTPDVFAIQEANGFTKGLLQEFAEKIGHKYSELLSYNGFPVAITSKYPISNVKKVMTSAQQGYICATIQGVNFIVLHLDSSSKDVRTSQINAALTNVDKSDKQKWLIMGDFNCVSPLDKNDLANKSGPKEYDINAKLLDDYKFIDVVRYKQNKFISTARTEFFLAKQGDPNWMTRVDFIYASSDLKNDIINANVIQDVFTKRYSDHYPVVLELKLN